jgi:hypothetical protein
MAEKGISLSQNVKPGKSVPPETDDMAKQFCVLNEINTIIPATER